MRLDVVVADGAAACPGTKSISLSLSLTVCVCVCARLQYSSAVTMSNQQPRAAAAAELNDVFALDIVSPRAL